MSHPLLLNLIWLFVGRPWDEASRVSIALTSILSWILPRVRRRRTQPPEGHCLSASSYSLVYVYDEMASRPNSLKSLEA